MRFANSGLCSEFFDPVGKFTKYQPVLAFWVSGCFSYLLCFSSAFLQVCVNRRTQNFKLKVVVVCSQEREGGGDDEAGG